MRDYARATNLALEKARAMVKKNHRLTTLLRPPRRKRKSSVTVMSWMARLESAKRK